MFLNPPIIKSINSDKSPLLSLALSDHSLLLVLSGRLFLSPLLSVLLSPPNSSLCSLSPVLSPLFYVLSPPRSSLLCSLPSMFSDLLLSCIFSLLNVLLSPLFYVLLSPPPLSSWLLLSVCFPLGAGGEPGGRDPLLTTQCGSEAPSWFITPLREHWSTFHRHNECEGTRTV